MTTDDLGQVARLQPGRGVGLETKIGAVGNPGVHGPSVITGVQHLLQRRVEQLRQPLAAQPFGACQRRPATVDIGPIGLGKTLWRADLACDPAATLTITAAVQGRQYTLAESTGFRQYLNGQ